MINIFTYLILGCILSTLCKEQQTQGVWCLSFSYIIKYPLRHSLSACITTYEWVCFDWSNKISRFNECVCVCEDPALTTAWKPLHLIRLLGILFKISGVLNTNSSFLWQKLETVISRTRRWGHCAYWSLLHSVFSASSFSCLYRSLSLVHTSQREGEETTHQHCRILCSKKANGKKALCRTLLFCKTL